MSQFSFNFALDDDEDHKDDNDIGEQQTQATANVNKSDESFSEMPLTGMVCQNTASHCRCCH